MRVAILFAAFVAILPVVWRPLDAVPDEKPIALIGKVVPLKDVIEKSGGKLDRDATPFAIGLLVDGKVYSIIKDDGGRRFFKDDKLLNREYRISGRLVGGSLLQVLSVQSIKDGKPHDIFYWCDICAIRRSEKNDCECCGGPMELREEPISK